jgi:hypothetical protein
MSPTDLIYDGPSMFWHGKIPIIQFKLDDWPWNFLGFSMVRDTWRLEESINGRLRARDDAANAILNPALAIDSRMSEEFQNNFSPRIPGGRIVKPPMVDRAVEPVLPVGFYAPNANVILDQQPLTGSGFIALAGIQTPPNVIRLAAPETVEEFARLLYSALREGDHQSLATIYITQPAGDGLAIAIRDRLARSARGR